MFRFDNTYARLPDRFYARVLATKVADPRIVKLNRPLAELLGADVELLASPAGAQVLAGNVLPAGAEPIALAYAGHQFGSFVPQLGDGRAILLGEVVGTDGRRRDVQLKGAGRTPFSRGGDGRAALGPVLREYVVSEAMAALGVPTTRALAAVTTGERVVRDEPLPGAILTRVAASHIRVGTFQFFAARDDREALRTLTAYALARHYPRSPGHGQRRAGAARAARRRAGDPGRAVARGRLRAWRDEHGQHDASRARRSTTAPAPSSTTTTRRGRSARSTTGAATPSRTSRASRDGTWRASPRRCSVSSQRTRTRPSGSRQSASSASRHASKRRTCG